MKPRVAGVIVGSLSLFLSLAQLTFAQMPTQTASALPRLVRFGGTVKDLNDNPLTGVVGITFALYSEQTGGVALWLETQNVTADKNGRYMALLGSTKPDGLPAELFTSEQARWVGVQVSGQAEQPRVLLVSAPYALKAGDAETVGGLAPSAFVLAAPVNGSPASAKDAAASTSASVPPPAATNVTTTGGTAKALPMFTTATNIQNSIASQIGTNAINIAGKLNLPATGTATTAAGKNSQPENFVASAYNTGTAAAVAQTFQLQAEPAGNNTATPSGTLNLLYGSGITAPAETGLKISSKGLLTFASGQTFPGTGTGTVTGVGLSVPVSDFSVSGSPVTTSGTLGLNWVVPPDSNDVGNAIVKRDNKGNFSATTISVNGIQAAFGGITNSLVVGQLNATNASVTGQVYAPSTGVNAVSAVSASPNAYTIYGVASSTTGNAWAVEGVAASSAGIGVAGFATSSSASSLHDPIGVYGQSPHNGVLGQAATESLIGQMHRNEVIGVRGDSGYTGGTAVVGTADNGVAASFENNSPSGYPVVQAINYSNPGFGSPFEVITLAQGGGSCDIDYAGNLNCSGAKHAVVPVDGGQRQLALSAIESPKNWFEDFGSDQLVNGAAVVALDADFMQTVNTSQEYQVFLTPYDDCKGLYVANRAANSFEVHELGGGTATLSFGYRITALRKGYEHVRLEDHTSDMERRKKLREQMKMKPVGAQPQAYFAEGVKVPR